LYQSRHGISLSYSTLLRRLKQYGICRRDVTENNDFNDIFLKVQKRINEIITGPGSSLGYRGIWHTLEMEGLRVPRIIVQGLLKELDPEGTELRKKHRLKRRSYCNPGPNYAWHIDGYDKLKHWGFPIHGAIDGFSRKLLWLEVTRSNNSPKKIAAYFVRTVIEQTGCPVELISDLGTENGLAASIQAFFRDNHDAHRYVPSPRNQRIEGWWSFFSKSHSSWWRSFFSDLEFQKIIDTSSEISMECLWFCFHKILQEELDNVKEQWNTHSIRRSRFETVPGRPDSLYFLPELHGGMPNLKMEVPATEINYVLQHIVEDCDTDINEYQDYFKYATNIMLSKLPTTWSEALELYKLLMNVSYHGYEFNA